MADALPDTQTEANRARAAKPRTGARGPGRNTLPSILRAAGEVLDAHGYDGLSTTAVAQQAGVSTATVYRHFADKYAVLRALVLDLQSRRAEALTPYFDAFATDTDWRTPLANAVREAWKMRSMQPGAHSSRRALQTSPELWTWDQQQNNDLAARLARALLTRQPALGPERAHRVGMLCIQMTVSAMDLASTLPVAEGTALVEEAILMREAYLAQLLEPPAASCL